MSEWGLRVRETSLKKEKQGTEYIVLGGLRQNSVKGQQLTRGIKRNPWEAFEEVGFRCAMDITR